MTEGRTPPLIPYIKSILQASVCPGDTVLDIGCGTGKYDSLVTMVGGKCIATDITSADFKLWKRNVDLLCSGEVLPFRDSSLDLVFTVGALLIIPDTNEVYKEVYRVLKPGGKFLIFDYNWHIAWQLRRKDPSHRHRFTPITLWYLCIKHKFKPKWIFFLPRCRIAKALRHLVANRLIFCCIKPPINL